MIMNKSNIICGVGVRDVAFDNNCLFQRTWKSMINRCYSTNVHKHRPTYSGTVVCKEWLTFSRFKTWMERQDWQGKELDKDILSDGSVYSKITCCFVPSEVNCCLMLKRKVGDLPYGVSSSGKKYRSRHFTGKVDKSLGSYDTAQEAHKAWQEARATQIEVTVAKYTTQSCFRTDVAEALTRRVWQLRLDAANNKETKSI